MERFFPKNLLKWVFLIGLVLFVIEISSYFLYRVEAGIQYENVRDVKNNFKKYNVDYSELKKELKNLFYYSILHHPYRWYSCEKNYNGKYVKTDEYGWRIDRRKVSENAMKIACFGGSTMFSSTEETATIPYHLNSRLDTNQIIALNFGVGGYSSSAELMALLEVLRYEKNINYAIFYDGVNEVFRYIEFKRKDPDNKLYLYLGYPYPYVSDKAMKNYLNVIDIYGSLYKPYTLKLIKELLLYRIIQRTINTKQLINDYIKSADIISSMYICNVKNIVALCNANNIVPIFLLQPNIYTLDKNLLTDAERRTMDYIKKYSDVDIKRLMKLVYNNMKNRKELYNLNFYDLSDSLNYSAKDDYYLDDCHLYSNGNKIVADRIFDILINYLPKNCFN